MKNLLCLSALLFGSTVFAQEMSQDPIGDARTAISQDADFDAAQVILGAFESHALEAMPSVTPGALAEMSFLMGVLEFYLNQDEEAAKTRWAWTLQIDSAYQWDEELVGGVGQEVFEGVRQIVNSTASFVPVPDSQQFDIPVFLDGARFESGSDVKPGQHLVQARCGDGVARGVYAYLADNSPWICPCPLQSCVKDGGDTKTPKGEPGERAKIGLTLNGGGWYSGGEGIAPLVGGGLSYRPVSVFQMDIESGRYQSTPQEQRTDGGFLAIALSGVWVQGDFDLFGGVHATVLFAEDSYPAVDGGNEPFMSPYSSLVGGLHLGAAYNLPGGHQVGARLGYSPIVVEGEVLVYANSVSNVFIKYGF
jgi:hypothetical protein